MARDYHAIFYEGCFYHVYNRSNNNEVIFKSRNNYVFFLKRWKKYLSNFLSVYVYCLLPTHFHFLVKVKEIDWEYFFLMDSQQRVPKFQKFQVAENPVNAVLETQFSNYFRSYALAFNKENQRHGSVFEKRFKRVLVDKDHYFTAVIHYIHHNPEYHRLVKDFTQWQFCSYPAILQNKPTNIQRKELLEWFCSKDEFLRFHSMKLDYKEIEDSLIEL